MLLRLDGPEELATPRVWTRLFKLGSYTLAIGRSARLFSPEPFKESVDSPRWMIGNVLPP